ncbi:MAG TPA: NADH-quinone oxidoreductase subunit NuoG, partial [Flavitalea sp.]|nr:NADH-quinone oxidoreductase subunit NuoG [Flavitalea sp.]
MLNIFIDNKAYEVKAGKNVLEACLTLGFDLPYFCWHPAMGSVGACRQCAVKLFKDENDTSGKIVMSCMEGVREGMRLSINDHTAKAFREQVIEWLMTNHPHDCPVCDEGGSCHLQDMTVMTGHDYRRYEYKKRTYINQYLGPFIHHEMNRCIQCYRCVRFYKDYAGGEDLNVFAAHNHVYFGRDKDGILESPFSGNLAEVCPTGVFTDKTLHEHYTRKWDLTSAASVCQHCSVGCNTIAGERYGKLRNILNRYNGEVNGYFLCDRGRFGYEFVNSDNRITKPLIMHQVVDDTPLMDFLESIINAHTLIGIGSPRASMESNFALSQLVGKDNFFCGLTNDEVMLEKRIVDILESGNIPTASLREVEQADAVIILGEDIYNSAPMMALAVRQSVMKTGAADALQKTPLPEWHDIAIKELQQEDKGFMLNVTIAETLLDKISSL